MIERKTRNKNDDLNVKKYNSNPEFEKSKQKKVIKAKNNAMITHNRKGLGYYYSPTNLQLFSFSLLHKKYSMKAKDYGVHVIDNLIQLKNTHVLAIFNERMINDYIDEFLKRLYKKTESTERIPKFANYYKNYLQFFCKAIFVNLAFNDVIQSYGEAHAEVYYNCNYVNEQSKMHKTKNDKMKMIFTKTLKHEIEDNSSFGESIINYSIREQEQDINQTNILKISLQEESLLEILDTFKNKPPAIKEYQSNKIPQTKYPKSSKKQLSITERAEFSKDNKNKKKNKNEFKAKSPYQNSHINQITSYKSIKNKVQSINSRNKPSKIANVNTGHMKTATTCIYPSNNNITHKQINTNQSGKLSLEHLTNGKTLSFRQPTKNKLNTNPNIVNFSSKNGNMNDVMKLTLQLYSPRAKGRNKQTKTIQHHYSISSPTINNINININNHICLNEPKKPIQRIQSPLSVNHNHNHNQAKPQAYAADNKYNVNLKLSKKINPSRNKPQSLVKTDNTKFFHTNNPCANKLLSSFTIFDLQQQLLNSKAKFNYKKTIESKHSDEKLFILKQSTQKRQIVKMGSSQIAKPAHSKQSYSLTNRKSFKISKIIPSVK